MIKNRTAGLVLTLCFISYAYADPYDDAYEADRYPPAPEYSANYADDNYSDGSYYYPDSGSTYYQYEDSDDGYTPPRRQRTQVAERSRHDENSKYEVSGSPYASKSSPLPAIENTGGERTIIVDPRKHAWGAYGADGKLMRWGLATAGNGWCSDTHRSCRTKVGTFRMYSLGDASCYSRRYPLPDGGAPMPYCMYFNGNMAIHGSNEVVYGNISHGCVRVHVGDAEWLRYQFVQGPNISNHYRGTKVIVKSY